MQKTGLNRNTNDKFYTSKDCVKLCMNIFKKNVIVKENDVCIEPSAGNGAFLDDIKLLFSKYIFLDIQPDHDEIKKQDYLTYDYSKLTNNNNKKIHVIGNPPFGRQSASAVKFIKYSSLFCDTISFILPKSFKKDSLKKHFNQYFHLQCECDIPENSFLVNDKVHNVPCVFQIWIKKDIKRAPIIVYKPKNYKFVKKNENPDISFRRVGVYAGKLDKNISQKSEQSHYFIKFDKKISDNTFKKLCDIDYKNKNNTVGPKSISKQELIKEFNIILN